MIVAICDDDKRYINLLTELVQCYAEKKNIIVKIKTFEDPQKIFINDFDVILLDVVMPSNDGIDIADRIRRDNKECNIIIVTAFTDRVRDAFYVKADDFLTKPVNYNDIEIAFDRVIERQIKNRNIEVHFNRIKYIIKQREIDYIKAYNGYILIYANGMEYRNDTTLREFLMRLDKRIFSFVNRSIVVNLLKVEVNKNMVNILGNEFKLSRGHKAEFMKAYIEADLKYIKI